MVTMTDDTQAEYAEMLAYLHEANYPWSDDDLRSMWDAAGGEKDEFFLALAHRKYNEATPYYCINGCCRVDWHEGFGGNLGGWGPAGCSCDDLDDPRGPNPVRIKEDSDD